MMVIKPMTKPTMISIRPNPRMLFFIARLMARSAFYFLYTLATALNVCTAVALGGCQVTVTLAA